MSFHGRGREQEQLRSELEKPSPSLIIVYGRRRIGKSTLLKHVVRGRPHIYFQATIGPGVINLQGFKDEVTRAIGGSPVLDGLGPVGGLDHGPDEYIEQASFVPRAALLVGLIQRILTQREALAKLRKDT